MIRTFLATVCIGALATVVLTAPAKREVCIGQFATSLAGRTANQRHNATLSMQELTSVRIEPGATFSFNESVGTYSRDRGYRRAPVSYNGNLIKSWGGGVCQTSTTVYNAALLAGMKIDERHRHRFAPGYIAPGRDAAVAFDTIDLVFLNPHPFPVTLRGSWSGERLVAGFYANRTPKEQSVVLGRVMNVDVPAQISLPGKGRFGKVRNSGKSGFEVAIYRVTGARRELISHDHYPSMDRVIDRESD